MAPKTAADFQEYMEAPVSSTLPGSLSWAELERVWLQLALLHLPASYICKLTLN
ncbi:hypothetical protein P7K49_018563 [Saguinus oedipus]|uniref:Uncharacterized protein n=1 Tax=Saguinus oedipus TaxID=9490 RepID=A0ABQ9V8H7_SAGOE|nr:hypothetical protein P7K49_018563 [Saguinus oedipus]